MIAARRLVLAVVLALSTIGLSAQTARCRDGSLSYSATRSGTCSGHKGVAEWLPAPTVSAPKLIPPPATVIKPVPPKTPAVVTAAHTPVVDKDALARDARGRLQRSAAARHAFARQTGFPNGRPGWIIDHIVPLACGGVDKPINMQWQTVAAAKAKDKTERVGCAEPRRTRPQSVP